MSARSAISAGPTSTKSAARAWSKALGDKIDTTYLENVNEGPDAERAIEQLARTGHKLIFTTSFGFMDPTVKVAKKYPERDVRARHRLQARAQPRAPIPAASTRAATSRARSPAKMSKTGVLGYIGSFPIPEVISGINATMLGAQSVNPNIKVKIIWVNTWFDPGKEADAAKALVDQGADVLMQHTDSPAAMQIAAQRGIYAFGQDSDMIKFGPKAQLTAIVDNWAPYYIERTKDALDGKWKSGDIWGGLEVEDRGDGALHQHARRREEDGEKTEAAIVAGTLHPFKCPVRRPGRQDGRMQGRHASDDEQILGMNFYVKGIDDKFPGK